MIIWIYSSLIITVIYVFFLVRLIYGWLQQKAYIINSTKLATTKTTIVVPFRNEARTIANCLYGLLQQDFQKTLFEIILVNDHSDDDSLKNIKKTLLRFNKKGVNVKIIELSEKEFSKKSAIEKGIKNAIGDLIITTDADCSFSEKWLPTIVDFYENKEFKFIISPVSLSSTKGLLGVFQKLELLNIMGITGAYTQFNQPILCNGANLIFEKKLFQQIQPYNDNNNISSGDDMFFLQKVKQQNPCTIGYLKNVNATVVTSPKKTWKEFLQQRSRWLSKTKYIRDIDNLLVSLIYGVTNGLLLINLVLTILYPQLVEYYFFQITTKYLIDYLFLFLVGNYFRKKVNPLSVFALQLAFPLYSIVVLFFGKFANNYWKGRIINK